MTAPWQSAIHFLGGSEQSENALFQRMSESVREVVSRNIGGNYGHPRRALHAKPLLLVNNATFQVSADLPVQFQAGALTPGAVHGATVRFSNAAGISRSSDAEQDLRGMAVRLHPDALPSHDWLGTNAECHHARDASEAMAVTIASSRKGWLRTISGATSGPLVSLDVVWQLTRLVGPSNALRMLRLLKSQMKITVESLATETFWSRAPIRINQSVVKYRFHPMQAKVAPGSTPEQLGSELAHRLGQHTVSYQLQVQPFVSEHETPIEDASVAWNSPHQAIGTLTLPIGAGVIPDDETDRLSFSPWQVSASSFEPLGNMNRARRVVYGASVKARGGQ